MAAYPDGSHPTMNQRTPLYDTHLALGARMVTFGGWDMPVNYGSQMAEHEAVRVRAGWFDVSHMSILDLSGADATRWLQHLLANDVAKLKHDGKALYSGLLNRQGGVIDDLIVYRTGAGYRLVLNAATRSKDLAWFEANRAGFAIILTPRFDELAMMAVQGPQARALVAQVVPQHAAVVQALAAFNGQPSGDWFIARTGYTGEDGLEIMLPAAAAPGFANALTAAGVVPCGLGARDTLRLEAGMNLYSQDMDDDTSPLAAGMGWTIAWEPASRDFIGRAALEAQRAAGVRQQQVGLVLEGKGVLRHGQTVHLPEGSTGVVTSGTFSPTLKVSIAMARVPASIGAHVTVDIRGQQMPARVVKLPFVRNGQPLVTL